MDAKENIKTVKEDIYKLPINQVIENLKTAVSGLTQAQVIENQKTQGKNLIEEKKKKSILLIFLGNFIHLMALL